MSATPIPATTDTPTDRPLAEMRGLCVETAHGDPIISDVDLTLGRSEILGVVGESGSGKTTTALALVGYAPKGVRLVKGTIRIDGHDIDVTDEQATSALRGSFFSYVPQSPGTALNPAMRIGTALREMHDRRHQSHNGDGPATEWQRACMSALDSVGLPGTPDFLRRYPHQLSGGQQQRVCIAIALLSGSKAILLDEPTTGLDVITQAGVLCELSTLQRERGVSMVYISHDLAVVSKIATRVAVMYAGRIVETGDTASVLQNPSHPYTRGLVNSTPDHTSAKTIVAMRGTAAAPARGVDACSFAPRCNLRSKECITHLPQLVPTRSVPARLTRCYHPVDNQPDTRPTLELVRSAETTANENTVLSVTNLAVEHHVRGDIIRAVRDVSFDISQGECLALVGESGSGKSTIARTIIGLQPHQGGTVSFLGETLAMTAGKRTSEQRRRLQIVFQNPQSALNPHETISAAIERGRTLSRADANAPARSVADLMEMVRLPSTLLRRYPRELSGGERQRVCIARALACAPDLIVCDEITSALDVSVQAAVISLLQDLRSQLGLSMLFITHDMGVVANLADRVIVLDKGLICEVGPVEDVLHASQSDYARTLIEAAPTMASA
jgi:peptide/nickel transport system ATP-binding protein